MLPLNLYMHFSIFLHLSHLYRGNNFPSEDIVVPADEWIQFFVNRYPPPACARDDVYHSADNLDLATTLLIAPKGREFIPFILPGIDEFLAVNVCILHSTALPSGFSRLCAIFLFHIFLSKFIVGPITDSKNL